MELIERDTFLALLQAQFKNITEGEGHCVFVSGEAGIGKTSFYHGFGILMTTGSKLKILPARQLKFWRNNLPQA